MGLSASWPGLMVIGNWATGWAILDCLIGDKGDYYLFVVSSGGNLMVLVLQNWNQFVIQLKEEYKGLLPIQVHY